MGLILPEVQNEDFGLCGTVRKLPCPHCEKNAIQIVERTILNFEDAFSLPNEEDSVPDTE